MAYPLSLTCKIKYDNIKRNHVNKRLIHVNMLHKYIAIQHNLNHY